MDLDPNFIRTGLLTFIALVASLTVHEFAHAIVADFLGDDTPRSEGRVTLNPMAHIDPIGTILIPLMNIFVFHGNFFLFGWGRPVRINTSNFRHRVRDEIAVSLAGPAANLFMALVGVVIGALAIPGNPRLAEPLVSLILMNVGLAVFNLLPIPPLDGGTLLRYATGMSEATYFMIARWSTWVLLVAINLDGFRYWMSVLFRVACVPYMVVCHWINPTIVPILFPFF
jgi:Zn-dependent protease